MMIQIKEAVLHILDINIDRPVLSDSALTLAPDIEEYLTAHVDRAFQSDDGKSCSFRAVSAFEMLISKAQERFLPTAKEAAEKIFELMKRNPSIPCADFIFLDAVIESDPYFILLKMNYRESYIHHLENMGGKNNEIVHQRTTLPDAKGKADEAVFVNLSTKEIRLIEKKYEIDGKRRCYLSEDVLECEAGLSEKQKVAAVKKAVEIVNEKFFDNGREVEAHVTTVMCSKADEGDGTTIEDLCYSFYGDAPAVKEEFTAVLREQHVEPDEVVKISAGAAKRMEKQSIKTASGVEIKIPVQLYGDDDAVQFINNPDGTISLLLKGIIL